MLYLAKGGENTTISDLELSGLVHEALEKLATKKKVLLIPPDATRMHSKAGVITRTAYEHYRTAVTDIMPATGTHFPMTISEIQLMFPGVPTELFREHRWREDLAELGRVPADFITEKFGFKVEYDWPAQINRLLASGGHELILSIGQVVPHEIMGMANYNKNIFIGTGGAEAIHKSHYLGALYGMERIMGRTDTPVRELLNYASENFAPHLPVVYILTVVAPDNQGQPVTRGVFIGDDEQCFRQAAGLSRRVNISAVGRRLERVVVYLKPEEYRSFWLGNKAVYRTRMAIADGGELLVIAPGIEQFGEDPAMDSLIRRYGYRGTPAVQYAVENSPELKNNLSAAAHLIHGSSEGRFTIKYYAGGLTRAEIEAAGYGWISGSEAMERFNPLENAPGFCRDSDGEEFFFINNPSIGLWAAEEIR